MNNYNIIWYPINGDVRPEPDKNYLVTIKKDWSDEKLVTVGSYNYNPFTLKFEWLHGNKTIAFAELPKPY